MGYLSILKWLWAFTVGSSSHTFKFPAKIVKAWIKYQLATEISELFLQHRTLFLKGFLNFQKVSLKPSLDARQVANRMVYLDISKAVDPRSARSGPISVMSDDDLPLIDSSGLIRDFSLLPFSLVHNVLNEINLPESVKRSVVSEFSRLCPSVITGYTQLCMADIWDHMIYGMMISTICLEWGRKGADVTNPNFALGNITLGRLSATVKEPNSPSGQERSSYGIFQILSTHWNNPPYNGFSLPDKSFYAQACFFFDIMKNNSNMASVIMRNNHILRDDPIWMRNLYSKGDLLSYLLIMRRLYVGWTNFNPKIHNDEWFSRLFVFAAITLGVAYQRGGMLKFYPKFG